MHRYRSKEAALDDIFSWRLVPSSLYDQRPVQPSLVCGAQHFVRLFGKGAHYHNQSCNMQTVFAAEVGNVRKLLDLSAVNSIGDS